MAEVKVETGVDKLVHFLESHGKTSLKDAAKAIDVDESTLQLWVDFLIEEQIIGVEYKFTKPYLFLNKKDAAVEIVEDDEKPTIYFFKNKFFQNARTKKIPEEKIISLWHKHLIEALDKEKDFFIREARKQFVSNPDKLFVQYHQRLLSS